MFNSAPKAFSAAFDLVSLKFANVCLADSVKHLVVGVKQVCIYAVCVYMSHRFFLQSYQHLVGTQLAHSWSFAQSHTGTHDKLYKRIWSNQLRWGGKIVTRNVGLRQGNNTQPDRADLSVIDRCSVIRETHTLKCNGKLSLRAANHTLSLLSFSDYSKLATSGQTKPDITVYPHIYIRPLTMSCFTQVI